MIGILIHEKLNGFTDLTDILGVDKVFPLIVQDDVEVPHIAYGVRHFPPDYVKSGTIVGGAVVDHIEVAIRVSSLSYKEIQDIVAQVRLALESSELTSGNITTKPMTIYSIDESYDRQTRNYHSMVIFKIVTNRIVS